MRRVTSVLLVLLAPVAQAASTEELLLALQATVEDLSGRVAALEAENAELKMQVAIPDTSADDDVSPINFSGDLYFRHEEIDLENSNQQTRDRYRARLLARATLSDDLVVGIGLATGGFSPVSSTQTIGGAGTKKPVALDMAYFDWAPTDGMHLRIGKFQNPLEVAPGYRVFWDNEWRPEGFALHYDRGNVFATALAHWLESDSLVRERTLSASLQAGYRMPFAGGDLVLGGAWHDVPVKGQPAFIGTSFYGNQFECTDATDFGTCVYSNSFRDLALFASYNHDFDRFAIRLHAHVAENVEVDNFGSSWTVGAEIRSFHENPLKFEYFYMDTEADSVFALLTDSDFGGGGTDANGHVFQGTYSIRDNWNLILAYFNNEVGGNLGPTERDYERWRISTSFNF